MTNSYYYAGAFISLLMGQENALDVNGIATPSNLERGEKHDQVPMYAVRRYALIIPPVVSYAIAPHCIMLPPLCPAQEK